MQRDLCMGREHPSLGCKSQLRVYWEKDFLDLCKDHCDVIIWQHEYGYFVKWCYVS